MLMLVNGDYVPQGNGLRSAKGDEAVLQRMLMKLTARRGQFPFMEDFGSRLWTLDRLRPAERQAAAEQYVLEALRDEPGLTVEQVTLAENGGKGVPDGERRQRRTPIDGGGGLGAGGSDDVRATETIYREMLSAYAKRRGGQLQEDCDLSVRLWAAAAQIQALEAPGGMGAGAELSTDSCRGLSGPPRSHARYRPTGTQQGDRSVDLSAVQRTDRRGERGDRNGVHDGGNCPVPDYGAGDDPGWGDFGDRGGGGRGGWQ